MLWGQPLTSGKMLAVTTDMKATIKSGSIRATLQQASKCQEFKAGEGTDALWR